MWKLVMIVRSREIKENISQCGVIWKDDDDVVDKPMVPCLSVM